MFRSGKIVKWVLLALVIIILVLVIAVMAVGDRVVKVAVETAATKTLNVGVTVDEVEISPFKGRVEMEDLVVNNPPGYETDNLMQLGEIKVAAKIKELMGDPIKVSEIKLERLQVTLEQKGMTNNLNDMLNSIKKSEDKKPEKKTSKDLQVGRLEINDISVRAKLLPIGGKENLTTFKIDPIVIDDFGPNNKVDMARLTGIIMTAVVKGVIKQGAGELPQQMLGSLESGLGAATTIFKAGSSIMLEQGKDTGAKVLEGGKEAGEKVLEESKDLGEGIIEGIGEGIGGLFKSKDDPNK
jgi:hypothetical protein